jgi:hypothetical protein
MRSTLISLLLIGMTFSCNTDEAEFPEVITSDAQQIGATSVVIEAEIKETGTIRPIQFGFLWGTASGLNFLSAPEKIDLGSTDSERKYSILLEGLTPSTSYFVRSYTSNSDYSRIYYGNEVAFTTLP